MSRKFPLLSGRELLKILEGDARAEIALRNSWAHVANILEERVAKSLGQFQQETHQKKDLRFMDVLHESRLLVPPTTGG